MGRSLFVPELLAWCGALDHRDGDPIPLDGAIVNRLWLILATRSFWFLWVENILVLSRCLYEAGRWPVGIYPPWLRYTLTFLVPVAFATTVPAEPLVAGMTEPTLLAASPILTRRHPPLRRRLGLIAPAKVSIAIEVVTNAILDRTHLAAGTHDNEGQGSSALGSAAGRLQPGRSPLSLVRHAGCGPWRS